MLDNPEKINLRIIGNDKARWYLQHQARARLANYTTAAPKISIFLGGFAFSGFNLLRFQIFRKIEQF